MKILHLRVSKQLENITNNIIAEECLMNLNQCDKKQQNLRR